MIVCGLSLAEVRFLAVATTSPLSRSTTAASSFVPPKSIPCVPLRHQRPFLGRAAAERDLDVAELLTRISTQYLAGRPSTAGGQPRSNSFRTGPNSSIASTVIGSSTSWT